MSSTKAVLPTRLQGVSWQKVTQPITAVPPEAVNNKYNPDSLSKLHG